ncbi:MAG: hypothetical protein IID15_06095 [Candidatus Marinimicrobia bacterium]|nr:hypothetical protein [Candidatus Neomarinimicrobiota bacterium]
MRDSLDRIDDRRKTGRQLTLICLSWLLAGWGSPLAAQEEADTTEILLGPVPRERLEADIWPEHFRMEYTGYDVNDSLLSDLRAGMEGADVTIYFGTWCHDSRRQMPRLFNLMDVLGVAPERIVMIGLNRAKETPTVDGKEVLNIHHTPTFIITRADEELGRIIETPVVSLEHDLLTILRGEPYQPNHSAMERDASTSR